MTVAVLYKPAAAGSHSASLTISSQVVRGALEDRLSPGQWVVVTPRHWTEQSCGLELKEPRGQTRYKVSESSLRSISIKSSQFSPLSSLEC